MLILTAFIWGTAFVAQSVGMDYLGPFTFNGIRSLIGGVALLPCIYFLGKWKRTAENGAKEEKAAGTGGRDLLTGGIACGILLFGHRDRAGFGNILEKEDRMEGVGCSRTGSCRTLFPLYHRKLAHRKRRFAGLSLCAGFFFTHSGD